MTVAMKFRWLVKSDAYHDEPKCTLRPSDKAIASGRAEESDRKPKGRERCNQCRAKARKQKANA